MNQPPLPALIFAGLVGGLFSGATGVGYTAVTSRILNALGHGSGHSLTVSLASENIHGFMRLFQNTQTTRAPVHKTRYASNLLSLLQLTTIYLLETSEAGYAFGKLIAASFSLSWAFLCGYQMLVKEGKEPQVTQGGRWEGQSGVAGVSKNQKEWLCSILRHPDFLVVVAVRFLLLYFLLPSNCVGLSDMVAAFAATMPSQLLGLRISRKMRGKDLERVVMMWWIVSCFSVLMG